MKTDIDLKKEAEEELQWEPLLERVEIKVSVHDSIVTLEGTVNSDDKKNIATDIARGIEEVKDVVSKIEVKPGKAEELDEQDITRSTFGQQENILADTQEKKLKISGA
jgi:hypothetical protein